MKHLACLIALKQKLEFICMAEWVRSRMHSNTRRTATKEGLKAAQETVEPRMQQIQIPYDLFGSIPVRV